MIEQESIRSLLIVPQAVGQDLASATGFVVLRGRRPYLVTNWHVLSGRNATTGENLDQQYAARPDTIRYEFVTTLGRGSVRPS